MPLVGTTRNALRSCQPHVRTLCLTPWSGTRSRANCNVWVISPIGTQANAPVLFKAENKQSPLAFDQLEPTENANGLELAPGQDYRVLICPVGAPRTAGTAVLFRTGTAAAGSPITGSLEKARALAAAGRIGDALMLLSTASDRNSPEGRALEAELRAKLPNHPPK
jgi:hypothetical protein